MALYGVVAAERAGRLRTPAALVMLGGASYSIYLVHVVVILIAQQALLVLGRYVPLQLELTFVAVVVAAVAVGIVFSQMVEQPLLRLLRPRRAVRRLPA